MGISNQIELRTSIMVANILLAEIPRSLGWDQKVKSKLFLNIVMFHIKLKGITNAATC